ncbi:hypothetical protein DIPPA_03593 [Diplonema papillatum]|nr:hypothetical protein DIPPA_03593 [Diplonema papillatum]
MAVHLVHPHLHIMLFKNHSRVARAHGKPASTLDQSVKAVLGRAVFAALDCMDAADAKGRRMTVYLPKVGAAGLPATRSESDRFFVFINKRLVRWRSGAAAIRASWAVVKSSSHRDRDPVCVLVVCLTTAYVSTLIKRSSKRSKLIH